MKLNLDGVIDTAMLCERARTDRKTVSYLLRVKPNTMGLICFGGANGGLLWSALLGPAVVKELLAGMRKYERKNKRG